MIKKYTVERVYQTLIRFPYLEVLLRYVKIFKSPDLFVFNWTFDCYNGKTG